MKLPHDIQELVKQKRLSTGHARTLLGLPHVDMQRMVARQIITNDLSVRATEDIVRKRTATSSSGSVKRQAGVRPADDPNIRAAENKLRRALVTQVRILEESTGSGKLEISFFNRQDLDRIYSIIMEGCR